MEAETYPATQTNIETPVGIRGDGAEWGRQARGSCRVQGFHQKNQEGTSKKEPKASLQSNMAVVG